LSTDYNSKGSNPTNATPALKQGEKFKKYQKQITKRVEEQENSLEGFQGSLKQQTNNTIRRNDFSSQQESIESLRMDYKKTLTKYENLVAEINGATSGYLDRINPNNPYLNKTIQFPSGEIAYVTNQGVAKYVPSKDIMKGTAIPQTTIPINIPWDIAYSKPGATLPTTPPLLSGSPLKMGQGVGNEGVNVFVNKLLDNPTAKYEGCYTDNPAQPSMTFIGGTPPTPDLIRNGTFSQSAIQGNSYQYLTWNTSLIPGWNFNCVLVNNSTAWGFPMPYPNGNQCACIQMSQQLWTNVWINLSPGVTYTLTFSACGRTSFDGSGKANPINVGVEGKTFYTLNAAIGKWNTYSTTFTVQSAGGQRLSFIGNWTTTDRSTAIQNVVLTDGTPQGGSYTYDNCKSAAVDAGYQYFALQNVDSSSSKGFCAVSNSQPAATRLGKSLVPNKIAALWSSNTQGQTGNSAILSMSGALSVINSSGASVFSTPSNNANPANFIGCYVDGWRRALPLLNTNGTLSSTTTIWNRTKIDNTVSSAAAYARANNYKYFSIQAANTSNGQGQAGFSNDLAQATRYGKASNCNKVRGSSIVVGGGWSNAIYSADGVTSNYYLILQDDGNMCIYRGTGPNDNQGFIWASGTNGKQLSPNPQYAAVKGKYGKNWMASGSTLAAGDFLGSNNGNLALMMQSDGNLALYTFTMVDSCKKMSDGNTGGSVSANALYNIGNTGVPSSMTQVAYIDQNSELHQYPSSNTQYSNTYTKMPGTITSGGDIPGGYYRNTNVNNCQAACNKNSECAGFLFSQNECALKNSKMYPNSARAAAPGIDLYLRGKTPITPPFGATNATNNIDSVRYNKYVDGGALGKNYGLANANSSQKQQLSKLQTKLDQLTRKLTNLTGRLGNGSLQAEAQIKTNEQGVEEYLQDLGSNNDKIDLFSTSIENILSDSDIVVLQKNYDYLFWSILATGTVVVAMNIVKK
jgi:hypothetical protein